MTEYDVFISSKSEDYAHAEEVYQFLVSKGLKVFLSCQELDRLADADYADAIDEALDHCSHMIVVATKISYLKTAWVRYEWRTFCTDLRSGFRDGNVVNILGDNIQVKQLPASLRSKQSFTFHNYKEHILPYVRKELAKPDTQKLFTRGMEYYYGYGDTARDFTKAVRWFLRAAEQGHSEAQYYVGWCYCLGDGVERDLDEAEKWFGKAADQGNPKAIGVLGLIQMKKESIE
jgi:hypothetical protein